MRRDVSKRPKGKKNIDSIALQSPYLSYQNRKFPASVYELARPIDKSERIKKAKVRCQNGVDTKKP